MASVATTEGKPPRPEDATTLAEFQARRDAELDRIREKRRSGQGRALVAGVIAGMIPISSLWYWFWQSSGLAKLGILALALACNYVLVRVARHCDGTRRRRELERLTRRWQERAGAAGASQPAP